MTTRRQFLATGTAAAAVLITGATSRPATAATLNSKVGAYIDPSVYRTGLAGEIASWVKLTGRPLAAHRVFLNTPPAGIYSDLKADVAAGRKVCMSLRPSVSRSASVRTALSKFLSSCKKAGLNADVALWHEPYYQGLTAAEFISMFRYYAPAVRAYYPAVFVTSTASVRRHAENTYFPGAGYVDKCATDYYCYAYTHGTRIGDGGATDSAAPADAHGLPFGLWEFASSTDTASGGQTQAQTTAWFEYIRDYFASRVSAGKANADLCVMDQEKYAWQATAITGAGDYRIPLYKKLYDSVSA